MKLHINKTKFGTYYYLAETVRYGNKTKTKIIERIGKHEELIKEHSDPKKYAMEYVEKCNRELDKGISKETITINFNTSLSKTDSRICKSKNKNVGYFYLQKIYKDLDIKSFFTEIAENRMFDFDPNELNRFLVYSRILEPKSKLGTYDNLDKYYETNNIKLHQIYRFLDLLSEHFDDYQSYLYKKSLKCYTRDTSVLYYDCTNFFFEIEKEDENIYAEDGSVISYGLRKYGVSKEHRPNPIVQMGLFIDSSGIPLAMCIHHGSNNEQNTPRELEKKIVKDFKLSKFIYCSDAGLGSNDTRLYNSFSDRNFIVTQSVVKTTKEFQEELFKDDGWKIKGIGTDILLSSFTKAINNPESFDKETLEKLTQFDTIYKEIIVDKPIDIGLRKERNGKKVADKANFKQRIIITFSRKYYLYRLNIINKQVERAKELIEKSKTERIKKGPNDVTRFIKNLKVDKDGVIIESQIAVIDDKRMEKELKFCGFYAVATTLTDPVEDILAVNSRRWEIEESFRILKTNFEARPVFLRNEKRIIAHFINCYTALLIYRLLEKQLQAKFPKNNFTADEIITSLKNMEVNADFETFITSAYSGNQLSSALEAITCVGLDKQAYRVSDFKKILKSIS